MANIPGRTVIDSAAGARLFEGIAATETEAYGGLFAAVADDAALVSLGDQRGERRVDTLVSFDPVGAHRHHPLLRRRGPFTALTAAVHAADEGDIFVAHHPLHPLDRVVGDAWPVGITRNSGRLVLIFSFHTDAPLPVTLPA